MARSLTCTICGKEFTCKGLFGCWCRGVKVSKERRLEIKAQARDCVCPDCLSE